MLNTLIYMLKSFFGPPLSPVSSILKFWCVEVVQKKEIPNHQVPSGKLT